MPRPSGAHVINVGSISKSKDNDPRTCYVVLEVDGEELDVQFIRVPYDVEHAVQAIEATDMPDEFAEVVATGVAIAI